MKSAIILSLVFLSTLFPLYADPTETKSLGFLYLATNSRKLADIEGENELWATTLDLELGSHLDFSSDVPRKITLISIIKKSKGKNKLEGPGLPDGTEVKMILTRNKNGSYETVYFPPLKRSHGLAPHF